MAKISHAAAPNPVSPVPLPVGPPVTAPPTVPVPIEAQVEAIVHAPLPVTEPLKPVNVYPAQLEPAGVTGTFWMEGWLFTASNRSLKVELSEHRPVDATKLPDGSGWVVSLLDSGGKPVLAIAIASLRPKPPVQPAAVAAIAPEMEIVTKADAEMTKAGEEMIK